MTLSWPRSVAEPMRRHPVFWAGAFALAVAFVAASSGWRLHAHRQLVAAESAVQAAATAPAPGSASAAAGREALPAPDFTASLPEDVAIEPLLHALQRRAVPLRLTVTAVQSATTAPTASVLGRHLLHLTVRGPYLGVHRLLAGLAEGETAPAVLQRLRVQRGAGPGGEVEAQIDLVVPLRAMRPNEQGRVR